MPYFQKLIKESAAIIGEFCCYHMWVKYMKEYWKGGLECRERKLRLRNANIAFNLTKELWI